MKRLSGKLKVPDFLRIALLAWITLWSFEVSAQKEYNIWFFGLSTGLDFNNGSVEVITDFKGHNTFESSCSVCDSSGNLLFYSVGDTFYNSKHQVLKNSVPSTYQDREDAMQGCMILPVADFPKKYFVIHGVSSDALTWYPTYGMRYSVVDMTLNNGDGEVVEFEKPLDIRAKESFAVTRHANGKDIWVASMDHSKTTQAFKAIRSRGLTFDLNDSISQVLPEMRVGGVMKNKFSPDSKIFSGNRIYENDSTYHKMYRFDNSSGQMSSPVRLLEGKAFSYRMGYLMEFSPNSRFAYMFRNNPQNDAQLVQFDLSNWNETAIRNSESVLHTWNSDAPYGFQLGPNGKIYIFHNKHELSVIHAPNLKGSLCDFRNKEIDLSPGKNNYGSPYYPSFWFTENLYLTLPKDTLICNNDTIDIKVWLSDTVDVIWSTGDTSQSIRVFEEGYYWAEAMNYNGNPIRDSIYVQLGPKKRVYLGPDTAFCDKFDLLLDAGGHYKDYLWSTTDTVSSITVDEAGNYWVEVTDSNSCSDADTIDIGAIDAPDLTLNLEDPNCKWVTITASTNKNADLLWNTGSKDSFIQVDKKGRYYLVSSNPFCSRTDSIDVELLPKPVIDLGDDIKLCDETVLLKSNAIGSHSWHDGSDRISFLYQNNWDGRADTVWVKVSRNGCEDIDTVLINPCLKTVIYIPNAFSPNNTNLNETFGIHGVENPKEFNMKIFNRWGELIFESASIASEWNGDYQEVPCPSGYYLYMIEVVTDQDETIRKSGNVQLVR